MSSGTKRFSKLELAEKLTKPPKNKEEYDHYNENLSKGLILYKKLCTSQTLTVNDKIRVIVSFIKSVPDEGLDMLIRWRDMIPFLRGKDLNDLTTLLVRVTRSPSIDSHQRIYTAVTLYNHGFINLCYGCFSDLACDRSVLVDYRVEAARYLFGSSVEEYRQIAQESLLEIVDTNEYPSSYRYKVISGFISRTGISTKLNATKLKVGYDEEFVYGLQTNFFYNDENGVRERILSGQHMLQMECVDDEEKTDIINTLLEIADNDEYDQNVRGDAVDVVLRLAEGDQKKRARKLIIDLGFESVDRKGGSIMDRAHTVYNYSQNVHDETIAECVDKFIAKIINETDVRVRPFHEVHNEVCDLIRRKNLTPTQRFSAFKALNRVSVDTATFTNYKVTIAEIFVHVWIRIQRYDDVRRKTLEDRMIEELVDMSDTCSSGHSSRFVNVLSTYDNTLKISWKDQIKSNVAGRMNARIRDCPDDDLRVQLAMGMAEDADEEDRTAYIKFLKEQLLKLKEELYKEFVGEGYVKEDEFDKAFEEGTINFV